MNNRAQRRRMERMFSMLQENKNLTPAERIVEKAGIRNRKKEAGKQIHNQHLQNVENSLREQRAEREARTVQGLVDIGYTAEDAMDLINRNKTIQEEREESLNRRMHRQRKIATMA